MNKALNRQIVVLTAWLVIILSTPAFSADGKDLSFISQPIIDSLIEKLELDTKDKQAITEWLEDDNNQKVVSGNIITAMQSGALPSQQYALRGIGEKAASNALIDAGIPAELLGAKISTDGEPPLDKLLVTVAESDAKKILLYFESFPHSKTLFDGYAAQMTPIEALKVVGFPFTDEMNELLISGKLATKRAKFSKLYDSGQYKSFCKEYIEGSSSGGQSDVYSAGVNSGFFKGDEQNYYGQTYLSMSEAQVAEYQVVNPKHLADIRFMNGPMDGLFTALAEVRGLASAKWQGRALSQQAPDHPIAMLARSLGKERSREAYDVCEEFLEVYLAEIGL